MDIKQRELPVSELRHETDPAEFPFQTTADLTLKEEVIGQARAVHAIEFGLSIKNHGYNIFVSGVPGTGRNSIVKSLVKRISQDLPAPDDWCYINNFKDPDRPLAVRLPPGKGGEFRRDVEKFIDYMQNEIPKVFDAKEYEEQKSHIVEEAEKAKEVLFAEAAGRALELGFQLTIRRTGIVKVPHWKGKPLTPEELEKLTAEQKHELEDHEKKVDAEIRDFLSKARQLDKEAHEKIHELNRRVAHFAMGHQLDDLREKYRVNPRIPEFLTEMEEDILGNLREFLGQTQETPIPMEGMDRASFLDRYKVNLIVDNAETSGGPVVEEANPTYSNVVGRIERKSRFGAFYTNFTMIRSGSVLRASGGYLLLNALDVLRNPFTWDALKRIIKKNEVTIEDIIELYGFGTGGIKPEPIPVSLKIIMLGSPWLYYLLYYYDEDFRDIFKVKSDFDTRTASSSDEKMRYANFVANMVKNDGLLPFDRTAVAGVVDYAVRLAGKKEQALAPVQRPDGPREGGLVLGGAGGQRRGDGPKRGQGARRKGLPLEPHRRADTGTLHRGHDHGRRRGLRRRAGERPVRVRDRRLRLRQTDEDHEPGVSRQGGRARHRARGKALGPHLQQGRAHSLGLSRRRLCAGKDALRLRDPRLRAELRRGGRRQRLGGGAYRAPLRHRRDAGQAGHRHHRLDQPEGGDPAHRRREREDRRVLQRVQEPGAHRRPGRDHPAAEREEPHAQKGSGSRR